VTEDLNAAIRGLKISGASEIHVIDSHNGGEPSNLIVEKIEPSAKVLGGEAVALELLFSGSLASYDALALVGMHSMAATVGGFLPHTSTGSIALRVNCKFVGEIEWIAWLAGHFGVPTILVTGDEAAVREAKKFLPGVEGASVKTATARDKVECLPLNEARTLIQEAAARALKSIKDHRPYTVPTPIQLDVMFASPIEAKMALIIPRMKLADDRTVTYVDDDYLEALRAFFTALRLASIYMQSAIFSRIQDLEPVKKAMSEHRDEMRRKRWAEQPPFPPVEY
jgi:D-amino peptidase